MIILNIDSATPVCSVALSRDGDLAGLKETTRRNAHSEQLTLFIQEVMEGADLPLSLLDAVAVGMGPGSYTGLRIGVAVAKGLCFSLGKPLLAVPTLQAMASGMNAYLDSSSPESDPLTGNKVDYLCPLLDARRMEVYCSVFDRDLVTVRETQAKIMDENAFGDLLDKFVILFAGEGAGKSKPLFRNQGNALFLDHFHSSARHMVTLSEQRFITGKFEDLACFEPYYLKDFIAGKPRVKGLE